LIRQRVLDCLRFVFGIRRQKQNEKTGYRPLVSVLIPAYNEEVTITETIKSIRAQTYPYLEIIVIDDCSTDRTGEIARSLGAQVVRTPQNTKMKAKAINFGLGFCSDKSEIVVVVDADTILAPNLIELYVQAFADKKVFIVSGYILSIHTKTIWQKARLVQYLYYLGLIKEAQSYWFSPIVGSGCCLGIRKEILYKLGGFSEGHIAEDMALTWKGLIKGYRVVFLKRALCWTLDPVNFSQYSRQIKRWYRGFFQCVRENWKSLVLYNKRLGFFVFWYFINAIINWLFWIAFLYGATRHYSFAWWFLSIELIISTFVIFKEAYRVGKVPQAIKGFLWYWLISPIDIWYFSVAFVQEIILGRHLGFWEKGH